MLVGDRVQLHSVTGYNVKLWMTEFYEFRKLQNLYVKG